MTYDYDDQPLFPTEIDELPPTTTPTVCDSERAWVYIAPCGCTEGILWSHTADEAIRFFTASASARSAEHELGFQLRQIPAGDPLAAASATDCHHEPKWGVPAAPVPPKDWVWAIGIPGTSRAPHLVPRAGTGLAAPSEAGRQPTSLCRRSSPWRWTHLTEIPAAHTVCKSCLHAGERRGKAVA